MTDTRQTRMKLNARSACSAATIALSVMLHLLLPVLDVSAEDSGNAGEFISPWLDLPVGARAGAMGGAYTAVAEDGFAHLYNPAGLVQIPTSTFSSSYRQMSFDRKISFAALSFPVRDQAIVGLSWQYAGTGDVTKRLNTGAPLDDAIGQHEHQFSLVFGKRFSKRVAIGASVSYYQWQLDVIKSNSALFDAGALLFIDHFFYDREEIGLSPITDIRVGFTVRNMGSSFQIDTDKYWDENRPGVQGGTLQEEIPTKAIIGVSGRALDSKLLVATDLEYHEAFGLWSHFGAEYEVSSQLALRAGLNRGELTAGAGFVLEFGARELQLDYSFQADRVEEGAEHLFSLEFGF